MRYGKLAVLLNSLALAGCISTQITPQLSSNSSEKAMAVKSKVSFVTALSFSPDGSKLITGGVNSIVRVWDIAKASESMKIDTRDFNASYGVTDIVYAPDGKTAAISARTGLMSGDVTKLFELENGRELRTINGAFGGLVSFSQNGKYLVGLENTIGFFSTESSFTTKLADVQSGNVVREFKGYRSGAVSPDGNRIVLTADYLTPGDNNNDMTMLDLGSGREIWRRKIGPVNAVAYSPDGKLVLAACSDATMAMPYATIQVFIKVLDAATGNLIREIGRHAVKTGFSDQMQFLVYDLTFSPDGRLFMSSDMKGNYNLWNVSSGELVRNIKRPDEHIIFDISSSSTSFSPNGKLVAIASAASVRLYDVGSGDEVAALIAFDDGEWLITTPNGYYSSSEKGDQYLDVSIGGKPYSTAQLRESFFRPDLVKVALSGGSLGDFRKLQDIKQPPSVAIVDTPGSVAQDQVTVSLQVKDQGGGIGDVRLYRNGTAVVFEKTRNLQPVSTADGGSLLRYNVSLEPGRNSIRAVAFNADNSMQSVDANIEVQANFASREPALHAVVVGIKDYTNPRLALTYPVADARLFAATLENRGKGLFSSVHVQSLLLPEETTNTAIVAALRRAQKEVHPEDLFVFYVASHGTVDDGQYFLITSNVGSTSLAHLKQDALSQDVLKELISNIPASKKLVVLDTCNAGKMGDALQVAMMTRGMSDDTAMKVLSRAVGSTVLSASTSMQEALEGYKDHGLFTWVVVQGLNGAADSDRDGYVKTLELADYVDNQVPELADRMFHHKQFPIVSPSGQGFPLTRTKQ